MLIVVFVVLNYVFEEVRPFCLLLEPLVDPQICLIRLFSSSSPHPVGNEPIDEQIPGKEISEGTYHLEYLNTLEHDLELCVVSSFSRQLKD